MHLRLSVLEIFLIQVILYSIIWLWDEFVALYLCVILGGVVTAALILSLIAEAIEPSRVPRKYYTVMGISILAPVITAIAFFLIYEGKLSWFNQ